MDQGVNHENLFNSNGSLSHVYLQIKVSNNSIYCNRRQDLLVLLILMHIIMRIS